MDLVFDIKKGFSEDNVASESLVLITKSDDQPNNREVLLALMKAIKLDDKNSEVKVIGPNSILQIPVGYRQILLFGYDESQHLTNMDIKLNHVYHLEKSHLLCTFSLDQLREDTTKKKVLWGQLQKMYLS